MPGSVQKVCGDGWTISEWWVVGGWVVVCKPILVFSFDHAQQLAAPKSSTRTWLGPIKATGVTTYSLYMILQTFVLAIDISTRNLSLMTTSKI